MHSAITWLMLNSKAHEWNKMSFKEIVMTVAKQQVLASNSNETKEKLLSQEYHA